MSVPVQEKIVNTTYIVECLTKPTQVRMAFHATRIYIKELTITLNTFQLVYGTGVHF